MEDRIVRGTCSSRAVLAALLAGISGAAAALPQADAPPPPAERFVVETDGSVRDNETGLLWPATDNNGDVDWATAKAHCQTLGSGWRLPTVAELLTLWDTGAQENQPCTGLLTCRVTPHIRLSGLTPWSDEAFSPTEAWYVYFNDGKQYYYDVNDKPGRRALCVKRP